MLKRAMKSLMEFLPEMYPLKTQYWFKKKKEKKTKSPKPKNNKPNQRKG